MMTFLPLHQYASVPLAASPETVCGPLLADPNGQVRLATADALTAMGPHIRRWGLWISELPATTAGPVEPGELGCVEVTWSGPEDATGWPALTARLVVVPAGTSGSRLMFFSRRSACAGLATSRLDHLHRQRIVQVGIQRFLQNLGRSLDDPGARPQTAHLAGFARAPMFVHHLRTLGDGPRVLYTHLIAELQKLNEQATVTAISGARETLQAGRFRARQPGRPGLDRAGR